MVVQETFELRKSRALQLFYTGGDFAVNSAGDTLFTTCRNLLKVLNIADGSERFTIGDEDEECRISSFTLTDDNSEIMIAYSNDIIRRFSISSDAAVLLHQFRGTHSAPIQVLRYSKAFDGASVLATGGADFSVKVWNLGTRQCTHNFRGTSVVSALCFVDGGRKLCAGFTEGQIYMYDLTAEKAIYDQQIVRLNAHTSRITSIIAIISASSNNSTVGLVAFSCDQTASVINSKTMERVNSFSLGDTVESAVFLGGADLEVLTVGQQGAICVWSLKTLKKLREATVSRTQLDGVVYCPKTKTIVCASAEFDLFFISYISLRAMKQFSGFNDEIYDSCFISERTNCLALASNAPDLRIYSMTSFCCHLVQGHTESILSVDTPDWDDYLIGTGSKDNTIGVWRITPGFQSEKLYRKNEDQPFVRRIGIATGHTNSVTCVKFSHSKSNPFLLSVSSDSTLKIWSLRTLKNNEETQKLTPDQTFVAHSKDINYVDVSANDKLCVTASMDKTAKLWHIDPKTMLLGVAGTLSGHKRGVWCARFSKTREIVATCSGDCTVKIFSLLDKSCLETLSGHSFAVLSLHFVSGSNNRLISADGGGLLKVWDLENGVCEKTIEAHTDKIWSIGMIESPRDNLASEDESTKESKLTRYLTVGSDSEAIFWEDVSAQVKTERIKAESKRLVEVQSLNNFVDQEKFVDALMLTIDLAQPYQCLSVVRKILEKEDGGAVELTEVLKRMTPIQIFILLEYASQWNTNTKHSHVSQTLLNYVLKRITPQDFLKLPNSESLIKAFIPYSNRHYDRIYNMRMDLSYLDYVFHLARE